MVDLDFTFEGSQEATKVEPVAPAPYEFQVDRIDDGNTAEGRPRWLTWLKVINSQQYVNRSLPYNCVLPWIDPATGDWAPAKEHFALTNLCQGTGKGWLGDIRQVEVQQALKQTLIGATGWMTVGMRSYKDSTGETVRGNSVKIVTKRRK